MSREKYYVYKVFLEGEVIYVGKGQGNRSNHVLSGKSHNAKLNEYYYKHTLLGEVLPSVEKIKYFSEESLALEYESYLIKELLPDCNIRGVKPKDERTHKKIKTRKKPRTKEKKIPLKKVIQKEVPFKKPKKAVKCKPKTPIIPIEEDLILDLPDNYEDFLSYAKDIYNEVSKSWEKHQTFRTWLKSKKIPKSWFCFHEFIDHYLKETPDERTNNGGHNIDFLVDNYNLKDDILKAFNNFKYYFRKTKNREPSEEECVKKINKLKEKYSD